MATGDITIAPSQAAGFVSLFGQLSKGSGDTLNLPEGMVNIGGNSHGYLLQPETDWDPTNHDDGTVGSLSLGDDVYIYAVQDASGIAKWIASKNSTAPTGYSASQSRKIGGFHCGRVRPISKRYDTSFNPPTQIIPNSCWDLQHRPTCDPSGMVEVVPGRLWVDIYLNSEGSGSWPETVPTSRYNQTPLTGTEGYDDTELMMLPANAGKRLPSVQEFFVYAAGAPAGSDNDNDTAWSKTSNTGRQKTGHVAKAVSTANVVDAVGNIWEQLNSFYDAALEGNQYGWCDDDEYTETGKDSNEARGAWRAYYYIVGDDNHRPSYRSFKGGGRWADGAHCGSRTLTSTYKPWLQRATTGLRCVCDAL